MNQDAIGRRFAQAAAIIEAASDLAMRLRPPPGQAAARLKAAQDWVTEADGAVEALIAERLASAFPADVIIGEEGGSRVPAEASSSEHRSSLCWVIDPIDGTANYARGGPRWCVSLGLLADGKPVCGLLSAPASSELFAARSGCGATLNGRPIRAAGTRDFGSAMVEIGWGPKVASGDYAAMFGRVLARGVAPRIGGSGALALADVACGRLDGYVELSINLWDVAGALPILVEAGASVSPFLRSGMHEPAPILAAAPALAGTLAEATGIALI